MVYVYPEESSTPETLLFFYCAALLRLILMAGQPNIAAQKKRLWDYSSICIG
jgi:hypothetical protein